MSSEIIRYDAAKYKVVELATVTDETIEEALNQWVSRGWIFDQVQFVVRDASRRPSMAFLIFTRPAGGNDSEPDYSHEKPEDENRCNCL